jgi:hypothetical protein
MIPIQCCQVDSAEDTRSEILPAAKLPKGQVLLLNRASDGLAVEGVIRDQDSPA